MNVAQQQHSLEMKQVVQRAGGRRPPGHPAGTDEGTLHVGPFERGDPEALRIIPRDRLCS